MIAGYDTNIFLASTSMTANSLLGKCLFCIFLPLLASALPHKLGFPNQIPRERNGRVNVFKEFFFNHNQQQQQFPVRQQTPAGLQEGFYLQSCPRAEEFVSAIMSKTFSKNPSVASAIVRLFSHDCLVTGCDASILLDRTPTREPVEKVALQNQFLQGFTVIDAIKSALEQQCPGVVSCADILAFANRDSLVYTGVPTFPVAAGRRDALASLAKNVADNLPYPNTTAQDIIAIFQRKGLSVEDLTILLGAHSIGTAHCVLVAGRFYDPKLIREMDQGYATKMQTMVMCEDDQQVLAFDPLSQQKMDSRFYKELLGNKALLESDHSLAKVPEVVEVMKRYVNDQQGWLTRYIAANAKMGEIEVLTGNQGEVRKSCRAVNGQNVDVV